MRNGDVLCSPELAVWEESVTTDRKGQSVQEQAGADAGISPDGSTAERVPWPWSSSSRT